MPRPPDAQSDNAETGAEQELLSLANQARARAGVPALRVDPCLTRAARQHAALMAERGEISHQFPGEPPFNRRIAANCASPLDQYAENVAQASDAPGAHESLMHSPPHRENLLHPSYNVAGFGIVRRGSSVYVVQDFAHSLPSYSAQRAVQLIAASIERTRASAGLSPLQQSDSTIAGAEACALARADSLTPATPAQPGQARYTVRYTTLQPEDLPAAAAKAIRNQAHAFELGVCFARSASYPTGAYWVVLELR